MHGTNPYNSMKLSIQVVILNSKGASRENSHGKVFIQIKQVAESQKHPEITKNTTRCSPQLSEVSYLRYFHTVRFCGNLKAQPHTVLPRLAMWWLAIRFLQVKHFPCFTCKNCIANYHVAKPCGFDAFLLLPAQTWPCESTLKTCVLIKEEPPFTQAMYKELLHKREPTNTKIPLQ